MRSICKGSKGFNRVFLLQGPLLTRDLPIVVISLPKVSNPNFFYRPKLIFWIVMGCGEARFGQKGQEKPNIAKCWSQSLFLGTSRRPAHETPRQPAMRPRGNPHGPRGNPRWDLEATRTDLEATRTDVEAGHNDRKRAIPHPRKQRRISLHKLLLLRFLGCGIDRFL